MICRPIIDNCMNLKDSYGEICVLCNKCGRFNTTWRCTNCKTKRTGKTYKLPYGWRSVEFYDSLREPICTKCKRYFKDELINANSYSNKVISCKVADFKERNASKGER